MLCLANSRDHLCTQYSHVPNLSTNIIQLLRQLYDSLPKRRVLARLLRMLRLNHLIQHARELVRDQCLCESRPADRVLPVCFFFGFQVLEGWVDAVQDALNAEEEEEVVSSGAHGQLLFEEVEL